MKNLNLKNRVVNIFLTLLVFMATAGANNFSLSGMYQPKNLTDLSFKCTRLYILNFSIYS